MGAVKCVKMACFVRSIQHHTKFVPLVLPRRYEWNYSIREGVPRDFITMLSKDYDLSRKSIKAYMENSRKMAVKEDHKFIAERHKVLGPDLATAHFLVKRGARVKFINRNSWFKRDKQGHMYLPNQFVPGMHLEAIDATGLQMSYVAFDNMLELEHLRYLNFSKALNFDDWCLAKMYQFQNSLEFLDISGCWEVTENGLACLHCLKKLKGLKLSGLPNVRDMGLMILLLEEALPECTIFGVDPEMLKPPSDDPHSQLSSRMHAITEGQNADSKESNLPSDSVDHDSIAHGNTKL